MGGVRTALYAYLFARRHKGQFILRIEDTDRNRYVPGAEEYIIESLKWCGILPDEGVGFGGTHAPYRQSERKEQGVYADFSKRLMDAGHAYYAFDTPEELEAERKKAESLGNPAWQYDAASRPAMRNSLNMTDTEVSDLLQKNTPHVIRLKVESGRTIAFNDMVRGDVSFDSSLVDDKVLIKADGMPTYHLAHIVDDILMEVTHAIRGEEWLPSAPAHILIYEYLGIAQPKYAHLPLLLKPEGNGKLSKRDGDRLGFPVFPLEWKDPASGEVSSGYREKGYYPEAFMNMLAMLGWNDGTEQELFSMEELIERFDFERVHKAGARFDPEKAKWFNEQWLRKQSDELLGGNLALQAEKNYGAEKHIVSKEYCTGAVRLLKDRVQFEGEFLEKGRYLFETPAEYDEKVVAKRWNPTAKQFVESFIPVLESATDYRAEPLKSSFEQHAAASGIKPGDVLQLFRVIVSGQGSGVDLFGMVELLGRTEVINRIQRALLQLPSC
jgi:glutamyl-tRNA synthetase